MVTTRVTAVLALLGASVIELGTAADLYGSEHANPHSSWKILLGLVIGIMSTSVCVLRLAVFRCARRSMLHRDLIIAIGLCLLWAVAAAINTSKGGPFSRTNNGYFSTWFALVFAVHYGYVSSQAARNQIDDEVSRQNAGLLVVFGASLVEMAVAADYCDTVDCPDGADDCEEPCNLHEVPENMTADSNVLTGGWLSLLMQKRSVCVGRMGFEAVETVTASIFLSFWWGFRCLG